MLEAVQYCILQADAGLVDLKKNLKVKREQYELQKREFEKKREEQQIELVKIERQAEKEREDVLISSEVYKGLGKQCMEK